MTISVNVFSQENYFYNEKDDIIEFKTFKDFEDMLLQTSKISNTKFNSYAKITDSIINQYSKMVDEKNLDNYKIFYKKNKDYIKFNDDGTYNLIYESNFNDILNQNRIVKVEDYYMQFYNEKTLYFKSIEDIKKGNILKEITLINIGNDKSNCVGSIDRYFEIVQDHCVRDGGSNCKYRGLTTFKFSNISNLTGSWVTVLVYFNVKSYIRGFLGRWNSYDCNKTIDGKIKLQNNGVPQMPVDAFSPNELTYMQGVYESNGNSVRRFSSFYKLNNYLTPWQLCSMKISVKYQFTSNKSITQNFIR